MKYAINILKYASHSTPIARPCQCRPKQNRKTSKYWHCVIFSFYLLRKMSVRLFARSAAASNLAWNIQLATPVSCLRRFGQSAAEENGIVKLSFDKYDQKREDVSPQQSQRAPLLVLHGLFGSRQNWRAISKRLNADLKPYRTVSDPFTGRVYDSRQIITLTFFSLYRFTQSMPGTTDSVHTMPITVTS